MNLRHLSPLLIFILCIGFFSCGKIQEPKFLRINDVHVVKLGLQESVIGLNMVYFNPNNFGVSAKEAAVKIYIDSNYIGTFQQKGVTVISKSAEFSIPLEGRIPLQAAIEAHLPALVGKEVLIKAEGSVMIGKGGVFFTKNVNYSGRHTLDMNLIKNPASAGF